MNNEIYMHEYGHVLDSRRNGLGYLINIGLPSLLSARRDKRHGTDYHHNYWAEKRANTLAEKYFYWNYGVMWDYDDYPLRYEVTHHRRK
jgi:hypothetical protein